MARKAGTKGTRGKRAAARPADPESAAIEAALRLAAEKGWARVSLAEVAEASGLKMSELYARFPSKQAILDGLGRQVDREVLEAVDSEAPEGSARDRLFDVLMRRFDALEAHRDGLKAVLRSTACDPLALLCGAFGLRRSMAAMLEAAGLSASGVAGLLRIKGVSAVYLMTLRAWLGDDSADKAHTMAVLDRALRRAESWASMFGRVRPARSAA
jgi:AcrR family transcriptional regulator